MNSFKWFGSRPILYFAEPAAVGGDGGAAAAAGGDGAGGASPDISKMSDSEALESTLETPSSAAVEAGKETPPAAPAKEVGKGAAGEEINLSLLDEAQPGWLSKVADAEAKAEIGKLLEGKKGADGVYEFLGVKTPEEFAALKAELPGGRAQITALQTLSKEVLEQDAHIAANTPESNGIVVSRYLAEAPDRGIGLFRAGAAHLAKTSPEAWREIGTDLVNASLKAQGVGVDFDTAVGIISNLRHLITTADPNDEAAQKQIGNLLGQLIGAPAKAASVDPTITRAREAEQAARTAERTAKVEIWEGRRQGAITSTKQTLKQAIGKELAAKDSQNRPLIPASIPEAKRTELAEKIFKDVDDQIGADAWTVSQIVQLIGKAQGNEQNLAATKEHFEQAAKLYNDAAARLLRAAVRRQISTWSEGLAKENREAIAKAKGGPPRTEVSGTAAQTRGARKLSADDLVGENAVDDKKALEMTLGL